MKSVSRQLDEVRRFAESKAWTLDERYVYKDGEISGEEWVKRPGYQALRAALVKPPFKVMIVWEQSRVRLRHGSSAHRHPGGQEEAR